MGIVSGECKFRYRKKSSIETGRLCSRSQQLIYRSRQHKFSRKRVQCLGIFTSPCRASRRLLLSSNESGLLDGTPLTNDDLKVKVVSNPNNRTLAGIHPPFFFTDVQ